ncbi:nucleotide sugar dehydrogenase [Leptodontidium sp. MPI-SDFR-AT-0119]|nr:nucleotide sugar dehydrogenase [Leptodontidium sp. MPI-SDFR-AT-0119]
MKICYVRASYVGAINAAVIALANPAIEVVVVDSNKTTVDCWNSKHLPVTEEGLDLVIRITRDGLNCTKYISQADVVFLTVNTLTKDYSKVVGLAINLGNLKAVVETIAAVARPGTIVVEKSTVPCKTIHMIENVVSFTRGVLKICYSKESGVHFEVLSNPEFLTEGTLVMDLLRLSRTSPEKILHTDYLSSELAKLVSNTLLAQRISSINTISALCKVIGADITEVSQAVGIDHRIGLSYIYASLRFGGSCLKKDTLGLSYLAASLNLPEESTSNSRKSQSILVIRLLLQEQLKQLSIYDPGYNVDVLRDELPRTLGPLHALVKVFRDPYTACEGSSAVLILTPWEEFKTPPMKWEDVLQRMEQPKLVFDARGQV